MFSVLILTLNEERNLPACLASVAASDDLVVLDSGSTDRTAAIAHGHGARVFARAFDGFAAQRNYAHRTIAFRHPWVFHLDADERLTPALAAECAALCARDPSDIDGYFTAPRMLFQGRWLRRCTDFPAWQARFVHRQRFAFVQAGHGQRESEAMRMGYLQHTYEHEMVPNGSAEWLAKHRRYAREEAQHAARLAPIPVWRQLCSRDGLRRRRALKALSLRLPCRPVARLLYQYVLRGGFLDGRHAWEYCQLLSAYERYVDEALRAQRQPPSDAASSPLAP